MRKAEGNVPNLAGEDEDDRTELDAKLAVGEKRDHGQHHARKKTKNRDGLQNIEERDEDDLRLFGARGNIAIGEREEHAQPVRHAKTHQRIQRVERQSARALRDFDFGGDWSKPGVTNGVDAVDGGKDEKKNKNIDQERPRPARTSGPPDRRWDGSCFVSSDRRSRHGKVKPR